MVRACSTNERGQKYIQLLVTELERKRPLGRLMRRREDTIKWILNKSCVKVWVRFIWSGYGPVAGSCERGNGPSGKIKSGEVPDQLSDCKLLRKDCASWCKLVSVAFVTSSIVMLSVCAYVNSSSA
jgi:hypothetical protein